MCWSPSFGLLALFNSPVFLILVPLCFLPPPLPPPSRPLTLLSFPFPSLPFVAVSRFLYPALFRFPALFLVFLSLCLSVTLSVCRSASLYLILCFSLPCCLCFSPLLSPVPIGFPRSPILSFPVLLCLCVSVSPSLCLMSLYSFVPSALDPQPNPGCKKSLARPVKLLFASLTTLLFLRP